MELLFEILLQFVGEVLLQVVFEVLAEVGLRSLGEPFRRQPKPWLAAAGYAMFGALLGALSLWIFPDLFITSKRARIANLVLTPIVAGAAMTALGAWRRRRSEKVLRLDRFAYGYLFALSMALVRFGFSR